MDVKAPASEASECEVTPTTTISTISLKSGDTRLVIALLQSREYLQLKVLEVKPELTQLGSSLREAQELQSAHDDVLQQLQSKQSPVEELLRQADQLISTQKPRAEVYAAMAESLGLAWQDVNSHLDQRKHILGLNVVYQSREEDCIDRMRAVQQACQPSLLPCEIDAVKQLLTQLHDLKRAMLESLMLALQDGKALLETLKAISTIGSLDSRPDRIKSHADFAITQVEMWLEQLHDRRRALDVAWLARKNQLEQCLALTLLAGDLKELEEHLNARREALLNCYGHLGNSASSGELLLLEHRKLLADAKEMQDRALKITKATEQVVGTKHFAGDEATAKAYEVLHGCAEYLEDIDQRESWLNRAISFFHLAHTALTKLDQLEVQLTATESSATSSQLAQLHSQAARALQEITEESITEGYALLETVRGVQGAEGVKRTVEELENRKISLDGLCTAHKEEKLRVSQALTSFLENQNELFSWLVSIAEAFLQGHQDMGSVLAMAEDFLELHLRLLKELQNKGAEINTLLLTLPPILEGLNDVQRGDVDEKVDNLHSQWLNLKCVLEARIDLATEYVKFHRWAVKLANDFDEVEEMFKYADGIDQDTISTIEQKWLQIQQLYVQLSNLGKNFLQESAQVVDPYLDVKRACLFIETLLEHFGGRQLTIETSFNSWQTSITHVREYKVLWERNVTESKRTVDWVSKLDAQLYPILAGEPTASSKTVARDLEDKLNVSLPEVKRALSEIELRVRTSEALALRDEKHKPDEILDNQLSDLHSKLQVIFTEYQILLQMLIAFFKNLADLDKTIDLLQSQYRLTNLPHNVSDIELVLKEHEASRQAILELFKFTNNECQQIINRIREQEPADCAPRDIDRLTKTLESKRVAWEAAWMDRKTQLEQHRQLCHFDSDLHQINTTLNDLGKQLDDLRGQYGESLATAKATSSAFVYFERTIEMLEVRIQTFVSTAESMLSSDHGSSPHIERELNQLKARWAAFRRQVVESRRLINLSTDYFSLIEEAEEWFKGGNKLLVTIARKSTTVKKPEEASQLLNEVELFLKPGEVRQDERIRKISRLAIELYGEEKSNQMTVVLNENREMMESFSVISEELTIISRNLIVAEQQRQLQKKEQEEADASLVAARAEADAAKAAAAVSEEARKAAEATALLLREAAPPIHKTVDVGVEAMPFVEPKKKSPSPPPPPPKILPAPIVDDTPKPIAPMFIIPLHDSNIEEGEKFTFECSVTGVPKPDVIWYKDGMSIQNNPDYLTVFTDGRCSLTIEETFTEDSAKFTCTAGNIAGIAETSAVLSVREAEPDEILSPPNFTKHLHPSVAKEGSSYHLECKVEGNPLPTVQWFKNDVCIDSSQDYVITYNNGEGVLRFEEVFLEDEAEYSCKAVNQQGSATSCANLVVEPLEPTQAPSFLVPLSNVMARTGQKIKLECQVTGLPTPDLTWSHNGKHIKESRDVKVHFEDQRVSLVINEAFPNDAGVYTISAKNQAGEASSTCNVTVKGRLPTETSDSELASDMEPIKPAIQLQLKNVSVFEGTRVQLDCVIIGQPEPEVIWYHDGRPVKESPEFKLLFQGDRCSLVIQEVFLEDAGDYKVTAINSGGEASSTCHLTVTSVSSNEPAIRHQVEEVVETAVGSAPKFSNLLTDILAAEGDKVLFECRVSGEPTPDIRWFLNNYEVQPKDVMEFGEDAEGNVSLTIAEVSPEHKGVYTVKATNSLGEAKCFAQLIVKAKSSTSPDNKPRHLEDVSQIPSFRELFADRNVYENEATKFECIVVGKPTPKIKWCFNDAPVSGNGFLISTSGDRQVLSIPQVSRDFVGKISCVAENDAGKASCVAILKIMSDSVADSGTVPVETSSVTEQIGSSSFTTKRSVFVQSSSSHVTTSSTSVGGDEPNVQVHGYASQTQQSSVQDGQKPAVQIQSQKTQEFRQVNRETPEVHQESFVKITNGNDTRNVISTQVTSPKSLRKSVAPRFMTPLNGKIVNQGTDVVFEGIIDGFPQPEVSWTKNGIDLKPEEDKLTMSWALNKARMELKDATVKDAGRYTCKAVNEVGSASSTADLVVKKTVFPPVFGRRLQAQMVKAGERVNMMVEVTGTPEPTVTWYKDGQQILGAILGSGYRTTMQGDCYTLVIESAALDYSGKYMVRAVNAGGEAQSIADFLVYEPEVGTTVEVVKHLVFEDVVHHTTQNHEEIKGSSVKVGQEIGKSTVEQEPPIVSNVLSPAPDPPRSYSPFTTESLHIIESTKTEKHVTVKMGRSSSPGHQETPPPAAKEPVKQIEQPNIQTPPPPVVEEEFKPAAEAKVVEVQIEEKRISDSELDEAENDGVQSASISKQKAFDFFVNKMHEHEEEKKPEKFNPLETALPTESFIHRREQSLFGNVDFHNSRPQYGSPVYALQPAQISSMNFPPEQPSPLIDITSQSVQSISSSVEEFLLQPEPPPEMGFSPKPEGAPAFREDVTSRVKRLEESSRVLSPIEVPTGAVRIFPIKLEPFKQDITPELSAPPRSYNKPEVQEEVIVKEEVSFSKSYETGSDRTIPVESVPPPWDTSNIADETLPWVSPPDRLYHTLPIMRPQADVGTIRPTSPRPSAEAVSMEKLWAFRKSPEPELVKHFDPIIRPAESVQSVAPRPISQISFTENKWSSSQKTEKFESFTSSSISEDVRRAPSPRPSAEGVLMEKLWTPMKPAEPEVIIKPISVGHQGEKDRPSMEGLKMDKIWAHKHKDSGLKKTWPPQEESEDRPILPWSSKAPEKTWPPVDTKVLLTQKEVVEIKQEIVQEPPPRPVEFIPLTPEPVQQVAREPQPKPIKEPLPRTIEHVPFHPKPPAQVPQEHATRRVENVVFPPMPEYFQELRKETNDSSIKTQSSSLITKGSPQTLPTQHYVSESRVSHSSAIPTETISSTTSTKEFQESQSSFYEKVEVRSDTTVNEERNWKPSEAKKNWPPNQKDEFVLTAPPAVKDVLPTRESPSRPQSTYEDVILEPGEPPEFGIARPPLERRLSYKETIEQELEKDLCKEPGRVPFGSVRIMPPPQKERSLPPPLPPKDKPVVVPPPIPAKTSAAEVKPITKKQIKPIETKFERFPDLEPFPYQADPSKPKSSLGPPPPKPSKFHKGEFGASDYDSDMESSVILPKWRPHESDTEELGYRRVRPPSATPHPLRPQSTDPEPLPPSSFDNPPKFDGPPRPAIDKVQVKKTETSKVASKVEVSSEKVKKHHYHHHRQEEKRKVSPPNLRPGSPPVFIQPPAPAKQEVVKVVNITQESGYMADTDEPRLLMKQSSVHKSSSSKHEETSVKTTIEHFSKITQESTQQSTHVVKEKGGSVKPQPIFQSQHRQTQQQTVASTTSLPLKVLTPSRVTPKDDRPASLEPFPFSVDPNAQPIKRPFGPPPASPSKFLKGDFRESDYESDYDGRIPPRWRPDGSDTDGVSFKPVCPMLTPSLPSRQSGRTPTPPTEFDDPPQFGGPPRPKFTPIEKQPAVKLDEILKPASKPQTVFKPKPVTAKNLPPMEVIIATPAVKEVLGIKPGSPPQMAFSPRRTTTKTSPYHNATQTETSNVVNFAESTEHSHRVVSVQQTTRVIKFGDKEKKTETTQPPLEPFPFKPDPVNPKRRSVGPPPTTPKKFIPGEFRESDYESDVEGVHFKPKWVPGESDTEDLHYRKVQPPALTRPASVPIKSMHRVPTPMEFDTQPPVLPSAAIKSTSASSSASSTLTRTTMSTTSTSGFEAEQKRLKRVEEMRKRFGENNAPTTPTSQEVVLKPGSPPELAFSSGRIPAAASYAASQHMNEMTSTFKSKAQQFVNDIITDVETSRKPEKPILKTPSKTNSGDDPQAYREESRLAEYGTKHIDPDTGLIYFKYDFGYEFGIVLPGEGKKSAEKKTPQIEGKRAGDIDFPVIHEKTTNNGVVVAAAADKSSQFRPKKFTHFKSVKWEPASESEMSENEDAMQHKKRYSLPQPTASVQEPRILIPGSTMSPVSLSPSLPSLSPYCSSLGQTGFESAGGSPWSGLSPNKAGHGRGTTPPSTPSTPRSSSGNVVHSNQTSQPRKPPTFITPLRDIAVVSGQSARFECIVQAEPPPNILWSINGRIIENSNDYLVEFRNGVCRLTIPKAYTDYAGSYTCTATNMLGTIGTTATLQIPGERRFRN